MKKSALKIGTILKFTLSSFQIYSIGAFLNPSGLSRTYHQINLPVNLYRSVLPSSMYAVPLTSAAPSGPALTNILKLLGGSTGIEEGGVSFLFSTDSYWLSRIVFLKALGFVYCAAFLVAYFQNKALIGDLGISPARVKMYEAESNGVYLRKREKEWREKYHKRNKHLTFAILRRFLRLIPFVDSDRYINTIYEWWTNRDTAGRPLVTILWFAKDRHNLNRWLDGIALSGLVISIFLLFHGAGNVPIIFSLWLCQHSLMSVGGPFYGFGWEPQLAELTFHTLFLVPLLSLHKIPRNTPVPIVVVWALRWHLFRIMIGAGLIKIRSNDIKWKNLTAMDYFYETQPVPNIFSRTFHRLPKLWHKFEVLSNHFVELVVPFFFMMPFLPRGFRIWGGLIQLTFQLILISSGNLSFLNWLTMVPSIMCLDDAFLAKSLRPLFALSSLNGAMIQSTSSVSLASLSCRRLFTIIFGIVVTKLSIPVVKNLCSKNQIMNGSFDPLRLINTYGAFGTVSEERIELVVSSAETINGPWKEYKFKVKPGDVMKKPRWITPYHYRLDWQFWIAQFSYQPPPWVYNFLLKLLQEDPEVMSLLDGNPWSHAGEGECNELIAPEKDDLTGDFSTQRKPKYIQIEKYMYRFNDPGKIDENTKKEIFWRRERIGRYFPKRGVVNENDLVEIVGQSYIEGPSKRDT